jgi:hypothetical protein
VRLFNSRSAESDGRPAQRVLDRPGHASAEAKLARRAA